MNPSCVNNPPARTSPKLCGAQKRQDLQPNPKARGRTARLATLAAVTFFALPGARSTVAATPTPTPPACPSVITQSTSEAIAAGNSGSCNPGQAAGLLHTDNSYWRAFNVASFTSAQPYHVTSVSFGIQVANAFGTNTTQPVTVRLHTPNDRIISRRDPTCR